MRRMPIVVLLAALLSAWPAGARPPVEEADNALKSLQYNEALATARLILESPQSRPRDVVAAYRVMGWSLAVTGRQPEAVESFRKLLSLDPKFRLGKGVSPKIRRSFLQAVGMAVDDKPVALQHEPPEALERLGGLKVRVRLVADPLSMVKGLRFCYLAPDGEIRQMTVLVDGPRQVSFKLPDDYEQRVFSYWFEAANEHGAVLAGSGGPEQPFELVAKPAPVVVIQPEPDLKEGAVVQTEAAGVQAETSDEGGWYSSWWFWTAVGVIVAGATAGAVLAVTRGGEPDPLHWEVGVR